jgi:phospholipid/cholesterol/gamma-HCH transport system substrate-binding protein
MNQETKVGIFLIAALATILTSIFFLGKIQLFKRTANYYVEFADVEALPTKAAVKIAGVEIGKVARVGLVGGKARVTIQIDPKIIIYSDAVAKIGTTGLIGTRFVDLIPGSSSRPPLEPGSTIQGVNGSSLNDMVSKLSGIFEDDENYGNAVDNLKATISNIRHVSDSLNKALGDRPQDLEAIITNIRDLTQSAKVFTAHLEEISTERKDDVKLALGKFKEVAVQLDEILGKINRGEGTIGALVSDEKTASDVKQAITAVKETAKGAQKVIGRFVNVNTYWNYRYRYDTRDSEGKYDLAITMSPRRGKYYSIGIENIGDPVSNESTQAYERRNRFTGVLGADLGFCGRDSHQGRSGFELSSVLEKPTMGPPNRADVASVGCPPRSCRKRTIIKRRYLDGGRACGRQQLVMAWVAGRGLVSPRRFHGLHQY